MLLCIGADLGVFCGRALLAGSVTGVCPLVMVAMALYEPEIDR